MKHAGYHKVSCISDNPQVQGINVTPLNMEVFGIEPQEQEGKAIYALKLECHYSSYLCTAQNKKQVRLTW
jgi:hypothetical protein